LKTPLLIALAALAFVSIFFLALPFPLILFVAAVTGFIVAKASPHLLALKPVDAQPHGPAGGWRRASIATAIGMTAWWTPVLVAFALLGPGHVLSSVGVFFSTLAVVTFGGAYAVLAYMAQAAVETYGWMTPEQMIDGLGLAETTPGPLILVTQFVGFLAAYGNPAPFSPIAAGLIAAALTTWVTFVPSMMWIFVGAPYIERLRSDRRLAGALAAITAAVVGVVLNLSVWFALHVLFGHVQEQRIGWLRWFAFDPLALDLKVTALAAIAAVLAFVLHRGLIELIVVMAGLGIVTRLVFSA
jgi:chromate transporter